MGYCMNLSFKQDESELYKYIKSKRNPSGYIKDLIEIDMKKEITNLSQKQVKNNEKSIKN